MKIRKDNSRILIIPKTFHKTFSLINIEIKIKTSDYNNNNFN